MEGDYSDCKKYETIVARLVGETYELSDDDANYIASHSGLCPTHSLNSEGRRLGFKEGELEARAKDGALLLKPLFDRRIQPPYN